MGISVHVYQLKDIHLCVHNILKYHIRIFQVMGRGYDFTVTSTTSVPLRGYVVVKVTIFFLIFPISKMSKWNQDRYLNGK